MECVLCGNSITSYDVDYGNADVFCYTTADLIDVDAPVHVDCEAPNYN